MENKQMSKYLPGGEYWNTMLIASNDPDIHGIMWPKNRVRGDETMRSDMAIAIELRNGKEVTFVAKIPHSSVKVFNRCERISTLFATPCYFEPVLPYDGPLSGLSAGYDPVDPEDSWVYIVRRKRDYEKQFKTFIIKPYKK